MVPAELLDLGHQVWRDPDLYREWCRREGLSNKPGRTWAERFQRGRDAWAIAHDVVKGPGGQVINHARLIDTFHIPWCGSLTQAMAAGEAKAPDPEGFRRQCLLAPYGPIPDTFPRTDPREKGA